MKIENIKNNYELIEDKKSFWELCSQEFGLRVASIRVNWFTNFYIPEKHEDRIIQLQQNTIKHQNERITSNSH